MKLNTTNAIYWNIFFALLVIFSLGGLVVAWSTYVPIRGAVIASGFVVVETGVKAVQHPVGGIVGEIRVKEGQKVFADDVVVRLDDTATRASLDIILNELVALRARRLRLIAEQTGANSIASPEELVTRSQTDLDVADSLKSEEKLFQSRRKSNDGQKSQLRERIKQLQSEILGLQKQGAALREHLSIVERELADLSGLDEKGLVQRPRLMAAKKDLTRTKGFIGENEAKIAQAHGRIAETELKLLQIDQEFSTEAARQRRDVETRIGELRARQTAAEDVLRRIEIRAPISGVIHQLSVHTLGGVIPPTQPIMMIVPTSDRLTVDARVAVTDIDQIELNQQSRVRFTAFDFNTTPVLNGVVYRVAADLTVDPGTDAPYYSVGIEVSDKELKRLRTLRVVPGMPVEAHITTRERTVASYLLKPVLDQMQRAMREE